MSEYLPIIIVAAVLILGGVVVAWVKSATAARKDKV